MISINSNTSVRVSTPFGGFKQSGVRPRARPDALDAYTEVKNVYYATEEDEHARKARRQGLRDHRRGGGIGAESARLFAARGRDGGRGRPRRRAGAPGELSIAGRRRRRGAGPAAMRDGASSEYGRIDVLFNNAGINPTDDGSVLETTLEAWQRVQDVNLRSVFLCCKHGIPHLLETRRRLGDQHRLLRRGDGRRDLADLLHRLEGRRARALARARRRVRAPRRPRQRALPGPGQHAAAAGALRQGPRAGRAAPRPRADGPLRASPRRSPPAALFLASDESSFVTASTFLVDGGLSGAYTTPLE